MTTGVVLSCLHREVMHLEFSNVNRSEKTLRLQGKRQWRFKVKTHEQREVPVPDDLLAELKERKAKLISR